MRHLLFLPFLLFPIIIQAQPPVKTIPGVLTNDVMAGSSEYNKVSSSGLTIALKRGGSREFVIFNIQKGTITQADKQMSKISADHRYLFENETFVARRNEKGESRWAWEIRSIGISSDTLARRLAAISSPKATQEPFLKDRRQDLAQH